MRSLVIRLRTMRSFSYTASTSLRATGGVNLPNSDIFSQITWLSIARKVSITLLRWRSHCLRHRLRGMTPFQNFNYSAYVEYAVGLKQSLYKSENLMDVGGTKLRQRNRNPYIRPHSGTIWLIRATFMNGPNGGPHHGFVDEFIQNIRKMYPECLPNVSRYRLDHILCRSR